MRWNTGLARGGKIIMGASSLVPQAGTNANACTYAGDGSTSDRSEYTRPHAQLRCQARSPRTAHFFIHIPGRPALLCQCCQISACTGLASSPLLDSTSTHPTPTCLNYTPVLLRLPPLCLVWTWYIIIGNVPLMLAGWDQREGSYGVALGVRASVVFTCW